MNNITFKEVGSNIQQLLNKKNMTQQSLADKLTVSRQVMNKIISGTKAINVAEISKIAAILGTSVDSLLSPVAKESEVLAFSFMGKVSSETTRKKISTLNEVIKEILLLEEIAHV